MLGLLQLSAQPVEGVSAVSVSSRLGSTLSSTLFQRKHEDSDRWVVVAMTGRSLQFIGRRILSASPTCTDSLHPNDRTVDQQAEYVEAPGECRAGNEEDHGVHAIDHHGGEEGKGDVTVATTIQEKYRLPRTVWDTNARFPSENEDTKPRTEGTRTPCVEAGIDPTTTVTRAEFDQVQTEALCL